VEDIRLYILLGFEHVFPFGSDHVLFIVSLFLFKSNWKDLLAQSVVFTLAHSLSLLLAFLGLPFPSSLWVEPIIALSIVYTSLENVFPRYFLLNRLAIVGIFGLFHGLGFAGIIQQLLAGSDSLFIPLFSFNLGIEAAQIFILLLLWVMVHSSGLSKLTLYQEKLSKAMSLGIGLIASYWFLERIGQLL
jgi:hydrogenase/urease accessory protein HupE